MATPNFSPAEFRCRHCGQGDDIVKPELLAALQRLRDLYRKPMSVTSGYRCPVHNKAIGGAKRSAHLTGEAADISDPKGDLKLFCTEAVLQAVGLWMEHPSATPGWAHLQVRPVGTRIFRP
jgi:hypothetical protein